MTASNALRGKSYVRASTAEKVLKAAKQLNYQPNLAARRLSSGKTNVLGFSTVELDYSPFSAALAAAVSDRAFRLGYQTLIQQTRYMAEYELSMVSEISTQFCEGTILSAPMLSTEAIVQVNEHYPVVIFDGPDLEGMVDSVRSPDEEGAKAAVDLLIARGCRRILLLGMARLTDDELHHADRSQALRLRGAQRALLGHGLPFTNDNVYMCQWHYAAAEDMIESVLAERMDFDGIFCATDVVAIGVLNALQRHGIRIPEDVAVIGFDGLAESRYVKPTLSTVALDVNTVAETCLQLLMDRIHDTPETHIPKQVMLPFTLIERESTAR